jgi:hypothetical protein
MEAQQVIISLAAVIVVGYSGAERKLLPLFRRLSGILARETTIYAKKKACSSRPSIAFYKFIAAALGQP